MTPQEAKLKAAIRAMYRDNWNPKNIEKVIEDSHNEVKAMFCKPTPNELVSKWITELGAASYSYFEILEVFKRAGEIYSESQS